MFLLPVFKWAYNNIKQTLASLAWVQETVSQSGEENLSLLYIMWVVLNLAKHVYEDKPFSHFNPQVSSMCSTFSSCSGVLQEQDLVSCNETSAMGHCCRFFLCLCADMLSCKMSSLCLKAQSWWRWAQLVGVLFQSSLAIQQATLCMGLTFQQGYIALVAFRFLEEQKHVSSSVQNVQSWFYSKKERRNVIRFLKFVFLSYIVVFLQLFI